MYQQESVISCFVPSCKNTTPICKDNIFFNIPNRSRNEWCTAVNKPYVLEGELYICEDHLNPKEDLLNYKDWKSGHARGRLKTRVPSILRNVHMYETAAIATTSTSLKNNTTKCVRDNRSSKLIAPKLPERAIKEFKSSEYMSVAVEPDVDVENETPVVVYGLCCLCIREVSPKTLWERYTCGDEVEVYGDMLNQCFQLGFQTMKVEDPKTGGCNQHICEACIAQLRAALDFRRRVAACLHRLQGNVIKVEDSDSNFNENAVTVEDTDSNFDDDMIYFSAEKTDEDVEFTEEPTITDKKGKSKKKHKVKGKADKMKKEKGVKDVSKKKFKSMYTEEKLRSCLNEPWVKFRAERQKDYKKDGTLFTCQHCTKKCNHLRTLQNHIKEVHYNIPKFICQDCGDGFSVPHKYMAHRLSQHNVDDRYECKACEKKFSSAACLRLHSQHYHLAGSLSKKKCTLCSYECYSHLMRRHMLKHGASKYRCNYCKKAFRRKTTLSFHERIHTGDKRKVCKVCGQAFVQKASLNYHMTKYHPEVPF